MRDKLLHNIVLCGGNAMIPGVAGRLFNELQNGLGQNEELSPRAPPPSPPVY